MLLLYATPQVTILPLFILYFGIGPASKIAFGMSHGMFPIIVTVAAGVQNIKPILLLSARSMGASPRQVLRWVIFPHMIPSFFTGMRLGMTAALLDRLTHRCHIFEMNGESYRFRESVKAKKETTKPPPAKKEK